MKIVSAYYKIPNKVARTKLYDTTTSLTKEEAHSFYKPHLERFFKYIKEPVIFFTDNECYEELKDYAGSNVDFCIQSFSEIRVLKYYPQTFWEFHKSHDPDIFHTWQLGAIWANKKYFVQEASEKYENDDWFIWVDAGCIRTDAWEPYLEDFTHRPYIPLNEGVYFQGLNVPPLKEIYTSNDPPFIAGALFIVHRKYINMYIDEYNRVLDYYTKNNKSAILDQLVMASLVNSWHMIKVIDINTLKIHVPDIWFFFLGII